MTDDLRTGLARAIVETGLLDGDEARSAADATMAVFTKHMQSDAMVNAVVHAIEREIDIQELVSCSPEQLRKIRSKRIARAVLSAIGDDQ